MGLGSLTYQLHDVVETLRGEGHKVGVLGVRLYRPFPDEALAAAAAARTRRVRHREGAVLRLRRRALLGSQGGPVRPRRRRRPQRRGGRRRRRPAPFAEGPSVRGLIAGIGGRDIRTADLTDTLRAAIAGTLEEGPGWIGIKL